MISLLGLDQLLVLAENAGISISDPKGTLQVEQMIIELMRQYSPLLSGVVLSPEIGFRSILQKSDLAGPIFCLERRLIEPDPLIVPLLMNNWNIETVRHNYGVAKLELFYNPTEVEAETKRLMVAELFDYCKHQAIDLILEVIVYIESTEKEYKNMFQYFQLEAVKDLRNFCSLIALEYPLDALGAVTITAELDIPWILTGRDTQYEDFKENLRTVLESGAKGFLGTSQFLPPAAPKDSFNPEEFMRFIQTIGKDRAIELTRILGEAA